MAEGIFTQPANGCGVRPARIARGDGVACVHTVASRPLVWTGGMVVRVRQRPCACDAACVSMEALACDRSGASTARQVRRIHREGPAYASCYSGEAAFAGWLAPRPRACDEPVTRA